MEMTLRWYGKEYDTVKLWQIRQVPGVKGVITTLYNKQASSGLRTRSRLSKRMSLTADLKFQVSNR